MKGWSGDVAGTTEGTGDYFLLGLSVRPNAGREEGEVAGLLFGASEGSVDNCEIVWCWVRRWVLWLETSQEKQTTVQMVWR